MLDKPDILSSLRVTSSSFSYFSSSPEIRRIPNEICYSDFFVEFLVPNKPCVFGPWLTDAWKCRREWVIPHLSPPPPPPPYLHPARDWVIPDRGKNDSEKDNDDIDKRDNERDAKEKGENDEDDNNVDNDANAEDDKIKIHGRANIAVLDRLFGDATVPVANCKSRQYVTVFPLSLRLPTASHDGP